MPDGGFSAKVLLWGNEGFREVRDAASLLPSAVQSGRGRGWQRGRHFLPPKGFGRSGPWALQRALLEYLKYPGPITKLGKITQMTDGVDQSPPTNFRRLRNYLQGAPQSSRHSCTRLPQSLTAPRGAGAKGAPGTPKRDKVTREEASGAASPGPPGLCWDVEGVHW